MKQIDKLINDAYSTIDEIEKNSEGLDKIVLFEAVMVTEQCFCEPLDGAAMIQKLKDEGLL